MNKNRLPYYKAYPRDFIEGTVGMEADLKGAYRLVLDLIYMHSGRLPDDPGYICGILGTSKRKWGTQRNRLIEMGKLFVDGEFLGNFRADIELEKLGKFQNTQRQNSLGQNKNNGLGTPRPDQPEPEPDSEPEKRETSVSVSPRDDQAELDSDLETAVTIFNAAADQADWPKVQKLTDARRKQLNARLNDCGGLEGWKIAVGKAQESDFCRGRTSRPWTGFGFDWLIKASNFTKVMEGNYDNRSRLSEPSHLPGHRSDPAIEQIARLTGH
ncbi:DUF1376 domain-containing protein [Mameliella sediminis]|uniref:DUF1376 domain-containing protein n=1 Tax=Mameliella sediminis TaxID=2836866 RepID=UPI001C440C61|nr:DUF1376 domain-containing protein [Mameliella sediminis]MBV7396848.1 YdaU family protein [Mameliella sediminis]MBY6116194.1 YdaU family protein [Antarctobacter heliothermus]MBY6146159.1 YdaU family protein [Mameliella alba]MCA0955344.1 YdaU family protein [Mameliella alba]